MINCRELYKEQPACAVRLHVKGSAFKLGQLCAPVFFLGPQGSGITQERMRFGLYGSPDIGKTSFLRGVKSSLVGLFTVEAHERVNRHGKHIHQTWERADNAGDVRFMDLGNGQKYPALLPSYRDGVLKAAQHPGTDFIEHPQGDYEPDNFHGALSMEWFMDEHKRRFRVARLYAVPELLESDAFQTALAKIQANFEEHVKPPPNPELEALFR